MKIDIPHELSKIANVLKIPVDSIDFEEIEIVVYYRKKKIGNIPFVDLGAVRSYRASSDVLRGLDWSPIVEHNKEILSKRVAELLGERRLTKITHGGFRRLHVYSQLDLIATIICTYEKDEWTVAIEK